MYAPLWHTDMYSKIFLDGGHGVRHLFPGPPEGEGKQKFAGKSYLAKSVCSTHITIEKWFPFLMGDGTCLLIPIEGMTNKNLMELKSNFCLPFPLWGSGNKSQHPWIRKLRSLLYSNTVTTNTFCKMSLLIHATFCLLETSLSPPI